MNKEELAEKAEEIKKLLKELINTAHHCIQHQIDIEEKNMDSQIKLTKLMVLLTRLSLLVKNDEKNDKEEE